MENYEIVGGVGAPASNRIDKTERRIIRGRRRFLVELIIGVLAMAGIGYMLTRVHKNYAEAEHELETAYRSSVVEREDGALVVSGDYDGKTFEYVEDGRILEGVTLAGIPLGGMDYEEARQALIEEIDRRIEGINISMTVDGTTILLNASDFNVSCSKDVNELIHIAMRVGRGEDKDYYSVYLERQRIAEDGVDLGDFELVLDEEALVEKVDYIANIVDRSPVEPYITLLNKLGGGKPGVGIGGDDSDIFTTKTVYAPDGKAMADIQFHKGRSGYVLNKEEMLGSIVNAFNSGDYRAELEIGLEPAEPQMTAEQLSESFVELSRFSTTFKSSDIARARNVQKAAGLLHCIVMEPGEKYSYNGILGPRYEKDGWLPAHAISGGEYIDSPGGGICQVSTTVYNALLKAGPRISIDRRFPHSIPSSYVSLGLDATVSYGGPDLVWHNAGDTQLLLFSYADMNTRTVYEIIYGVPDEPRYTYKVWSETVETIIPQEPIRIEEKLWPTGYSKLVVKPRTGYKVNVFRQKYDSNGNAVGEPEMLYQDTYRAERGEYHYGTGPASLPRPE